MYYIFIKPYTHHRIKQIFRDDYHLKLVNVTEYKGTRYGQSPRYNAINIDTNETVLHNVTLQALREYLTSEGYPLNKE